MANIYPPQTPSDAPASEKKVLAALAGLSNAYSVFHGVNWLNLNPRAKQRVGETDLIILHPKHGMLVVEIKGGGIKVDGGNWFSVDRYGDSHRLSRSPALQARGNLYLLKEKLECMRIITPAVFEQGLMGYAVWFPDIDKADAALPMDLEAALVMDGHSLFDPAADIEAAFGCWRKHPTAILDKMQLARVRQLISPDTTMVASLHLRLREQEEELVALTNEQKQAFKMIQSNRRLLVSGGAGTGKTLLAMEDARQQDHAGLKTLFLCFNRLLAEYLKVSLSDRENIVVHSFHGFVQETCENSGIAFEPPADPKQLREFFHEKSPLLLMEAGEQLDDKFEALIVDEGQDFLTDWWDALDGVLTDDAVFHCFHDANQALFQSDWQPPFEEPHFGPLTINCRNTAPIGNMARKLAAVEQKESYRSADGLEPEIFRYETAEDQQSLMIDLLERWTGEGRLSPDRIVILSPFKRENSVLATEKIGKWRLYDLNPDASPTSPGLTFSTIRAFKGLEADAIIIADINGGKWSMNLQSLYVAASRAKHLLAICSQNDVNLRV